MPSSTAPSTASVDVAQGAGRDLRKIQTGRVQNYALGIAFALIIVAVYFVFVVAS